MALFGNWCFKENLTTEFGHLWLLEAPGIQRHIDFLDNKMSWTLEEDFCLLAFNQFYVSRSTVESLVWPLLCSFVKLRWIIWNHLIPYWGAECIIFSSVSSGTLNFLLNKMILNLPVLIKGLISPFSAGSRENWVFIHFKSKCFWIISVHFCLCKQTMKFFPDLISPVKMLNKIFDAVFSPSFPTSKRWVLSLHNEFPIFLAPLLLPNWFLIR